MIFRSDASRRVLHERYRELLATWPVPSEQRVVPTPAGETFVVSCGPVDAPPLVLLHGSASTTLEWIGDVSHWSAHYRVHVVDLLGEPGGRDRMLDSRETKRRLPNATVVLEEAGHVLPAQTERVLEWLRS